MSPSEISDEYGLAVAAVYEALAYAADYQDEIATLPSEEERSLSLV